MSNNHIFVFWLAYSELDMAQHYFLILFDEADAMCCKIFHYTGHNKKEACQLTTPMLTINFKFLHRDLPGIYLHSARFQLEEVLELKQPKLSKSCPKISKAVFTNKVAFFSKSHKRQQIFMTENLLPRSIKNRTIWTHWFEATNKCPRLMKNATY